MPVFTCRSGMSSTATVVASLPVPRRRRDRQVRLQRPGRRAAVADRRVDVVHHRRRVADDQVGDLRGVDRRAAADRHEAVDAGVQREVGGLLQRVELRLDARAVVDDDLDPLALDRLAHAVGMPGGRDAGIGDEQRARDAEPLQLPAGVVDRAGAELDRRRLEGEDRLVRGHEPVSTRLADREARARVHAAAALGDGRVERVAALLQPARGAGAERDELAGQRRDALEGAVARRRAGDAEAAADRVDRVAEVADRQEDLAAADLGRAGAQAVASCATGAGAAS